MLFDIPTGAAVASFLALSALAHLLVCTAWRHRYFADLARHRNQARWVEYSVSSSLMIVFIAQLVGIADVAAILALFGVNASMILFARLQERYEAPGAGGWLPFFFECLEGVVPWLAIGVYLQYRARARWSDYRFGERIHTLCACCVKARHQPWLELSTRPAGQIRRTRNFQGPSRPKLIKFFAPRRT